MTISPNLNQNESLKQSPVLNSTNKTSTSTDVLTEERASNIGWYFIKSYYDFFVTKLDDIHKIYHPNASVLHDSFPELKNGDKDELPTSFKANGREAIKKCFNEYVSSNNESSTSTTTNRIVITSACFQVSVDKNIIIVTFGEWSKNDSPYKQFTQYFVLTPGKREGVYDVANDILRFIDSNGYKENSKVLNNEDEDKASEKVVDEVNGSVEKEEIEPVAVVVADTGSEPAEKEPKKQVEETKPVLNGSKEEPKDETESKDIEKDSSKVEEKHENKKIETEESKSTTESPAATKAETTESPKDSESSNESKEEDKKQEETSSSTPAAPAKPAQPLSWADLAYQAVPTTTKSTATKSTTTKPTTPTTTVKKSTTSNTQQNQSITTGGKYKKEEWYPIYIRGARNTDEKLLKDHLTKNFGDLKFFRVNQNIALCDFVLKDAQKRALEAKETTINGFTISLEPRESKTGNNFHNNNSSNGFQKQKQKNFNNNNNNDNKDGNKDKKFNDNNSNGKKINNNNGHNNGNLKQKSGKAK
ncbi:uncharacterized protein KGF55_001597 [Candida pseudojiufengensis]|uniref:uncharacterized protein n=1 Tax=Candida pseudojiufengensis TaxID=497109 RepID=UPI002225865D|nr:uncharacterized protein KGF55_001597 [Candida pseudojiufengensis]KAI5965376.1 hypothetical protein KGF55_001597 [Candida pseudojiufengensis]